MGSEKQALLDRLRRQRVAESMVDGEKLLEEWLEALQVLMAQFQGWLSEARTEGLFEVALETIDRDERLLGAYRAPVLKLTTPAGEVLKIVPKARHVLGAYGRVDLECPPRSTILVRPEIGRWQLARLVPEQRGWTYEDLTEETFWQAISELLP